MKAANKTKKISSETAKPSGALALFNLVNEGMPSLEGKKGFEIYQCYRDFFISVIFDPEKLKLLESAKINADLISNFQMFDPAYLDNFSLCLTLKIKAPEKYDEEVKKIDKYVRPEKRNEGLNYLYQECGGFLALLLQNEGITIRQSLHAASKLTAYSESTIEKSYRSRMISQREKIRDKLPPPLVLALLYWTLQQKKTRPEKILPITKSTRSEGELQKTILAYWRFTEKAIRFYNKEILKYTDENSISIIHALAEELDIVFPLPEEKIKKADAFTACFIFSIALFIEDMPGVIEQYDRQLMQKT